MARLARAEIFDPSEIVAVWGTFGDTTYFFGGDCGQDWKFLFWSGIELSCIGHMKE